jgi:UDP-apiose/xylose synthase
VQKERWSYAAAKQLLERLIWAHGRHHGLAFTIVRPFNVVGPRMDWLQGVDGEGLPRVLAAFMGALLKGEDLRLVDGGGQRRSLVYVDDFVDAIARLLDRRQQARGEIFNVGNPDNDVTIRALAEAMRLEYARLRPGARLGALREVPADELYGEGYDDTRSRVPDVDKAARLLGWRATTSLAAMLPPIVADYVARYGPRVR